MPQYSPRNNRSLSSPTSSANFQHEPVKNSTERRKKRSLYTLVQVLSVVFMLIGFVFVILGMLKLGPQFGKNEKATAVITNFTDDLGAIIDKSTDGFTNLSSGCRVHYEFTAGENTYEGSVYSKEHCELSIGDPIEVAYNKESPIENTVAIDWSPYDTYLIVGSILLVASLAMIVTSTVLKNRIPDPNMPQRY